MKSKLVSGAAAFVALGLVCGPIGAVAAATWQAPNAETVVDSTAPGAPPSGVTLTATGVAFLGLGAASVVGAQRRRWRTIDLREPKPDLVEEPR